MKLDWPCSKGLARAGDVVDGSQCHLDGGAHYLRVHFCNKLTSYQEGLFFPESNL